MYKALSAKIHIAVSQMVDTFVAEQVEALGELRELIEKLPFTTYFA